MGYHVKYAKDLNVFEEIIKKWDESLYGWTVRAL